MEKNKKNSVICCFVCGDKTSNHCSCCTIGSKDTPFSLCYFDCAKAVDVNRRLKRKQFPGLCYLNYHYSEYFGCYRVDANEAGILQKQKEKSTKGTKILWALYIKSNFLLIYTVKLYQMILIIMILVLMLM